MNFAEFFVVFTSFLSDVDEHKLQEICSFVASWLPLAAAGDSVMVPIEKG